MNRPVGVTILAVLQAIVSVLALITALFVWLARANFSEILAQSPELQESLEGIPPDVLQASMVVGVVFFILFGLIGLWVAWGLFNLKGWAWLTTLIFQGIGIVGNLANLASGIDSPGSIVLQLVISGVVIYYLLRPNVKRAFGKV